MKQMFLVPILLATLKLVIVNVSFDIECHTNLEIVNTFLVDTVYAYK
jgi:hypothetical protein